MLWNEEAQVKEEVDEEEILDKAQAFGRLLHDSAEFQSYLRAKKEMDSDAMAQKALRDFQAMQRTMEQSRIWVPQKPTEQNELKRLQKVMLETPAVKRLIKAQEELVVLFQQTSGIISEVIEMNYGAACAPAGGCC